MPHYIKLTFLIMLAAIIVISVSGCSSPASPRAEKAEAATQFNRAAARERTVVVDVAGEVKNPGVYELKDDARVHEAITAAGGAKRGANLAALNRAAVVVDGQQIIVPSRQAQNTNRAGSGIDGGGGGTGGGGTGAPLSADGKVSLNNASLEQLQTLPGVGPVTAQNILTDRETNGPFSSVADLERVSGIGPATVAKIESVAVP